MARSFSLCSLFDLSGERRAAAAAAATRERKRGEERKKKVYGRPGRISGEGRWQSAREAVCRKLDHQGDRETPMSDLESIPISRFETNLKSRQNKSKPKILLGIEKYYM